MAIELSHWLFFSSLFGITTSVILMTKSTTTYTIKQILADNWHKVLDLGLNIRPVIHKEVNKVIHCGDFSLGHALYFCDHCSSYKHVPFRCKSRFCNTCGMKYVKDRANNLTAKLINCKHRHLVFTIPEELRVFFRKDRSLLHLLFQASAQTISSWFSSQNKSEDFTPGFVSTLHTFGRDLKWNPHIHMLITEGASGNFTVWKRFNFFPYPMLRKRWQATLLALLEKALGKEVFYSLKTTLFYAYTDGFYVYAKPNMSNDTKKAVDYVVRYTGRPAMAQSRISHYDGSNVTFWYQRHEDHQKVVETISAVEFIKRLIIHIPNQQFKTVRYYGLYAKKHKHHPKLHKLISHSILKVRQMTKSWRTRILLSFGYDPLKCCCGHTMELIDIFCPKKKHLISRFHMLIILPSISCGG